MPWKKALGFKRPLFAPSFQMDGAVLAFIKRAFLGAVSTPLPPLFLSSPLVFVPKIFHLLSVKNLFQTFFILWEITREKKGVEKTFFGERVHIMNNAKEREREKKKLERESKKKKKNYFLFLCRSGSRTPLKWPMRPDWRKTPDAITTADWPSKAGGACAIATNQEGPFLRCPQMGDTCAFSRGPDNFIAHPPNWGPLGNSALSGDLNRVWPL